MLHWSDVGAVGVVSSESTDRLSEFQNHLVVSERRQWSFGLDCMGCRLCGRSPWNGLYPLIVIFFQNAFFVWEDWESSGHYFGFGSCVCVVFFFLRLDELGRFYTSQYRSLGSWTGRLSFVVIVPIISCWNSADIVTNDLISCPPLWGLFLHYSSPWNGLLPKKRIVSEQNLLENFVHWGLLFESFSIA